jgi:hypothetical protein
MPIQDMIIGVSALRRKQGKYKMYGSTMQNRITKRRKKNKVEKKSRRINRK